MINRPPQAKSFDSSNGLWVSEDMLGPDFVDIEHLEVFDVGIGQLK